MGASVCRQKARHLFSPSCASGLVPCRVPSKSLRNSIGFKAPAVPVVPVVPASMPAFHDTLN